VERYSNEKRSVNTLSISYAQRSPLADCDLQYRMLFNKYAQLCHDSSNFDKAVAVAYSENHKDRGPCFMVDRLARRSWKVEGADQPIEVAFEELPHAVR
jgi:hypothetical protein